MTSRYRVFWIVCSIISLLNLYIGWRTLPSLATLPGLEWAALLVLLASSPLIPFGLISPVLQKQRGTELFTYAGLWLLGLFSSLLVATLLRDVIIGLHDLISTKPVSPHLTDLSGQWVWGLAVLATLIGTFNARRPAQVKHVDLPLKGLAKPLQGFTIAQISDIHVGPTIKHRYLQSIVRRVNALKPDVIAITGDLVDGSVDELAAHTAPLADLKARHGSYFVTGNHDYYSGSAEWINEVRRLGITVLINEHVVLKQQDAPLLLAGVTDYSAHQFNPEHRSDPAKAMHNAPTGPMPKILLAHQPRTAPAAEQAGFDVQLSGHTHGGQFWPWNHFVRFQQPYTAGLHQLGSMLIYISRGTGYWGPPKRLGAPSEITLLRLVTAD